MWGVQRSVIDRVQEMRTDTTSTNQCVVGIGKSVAIQAGINDRTSKIHGDLSKDIQSMLGRLVMLERAHEALQASMHAASDSSNQAKQAKYAEELAVKESAARRYLYDDGAFVLTQQEQLTGAYKKTGPHAGISASAALAARAAAEVAADRAAAAHVQVLADHALIAAEHDRQMAEATARRAEENRLSADLTRQIEKATADRDALIASQTAGDALYAQALNRAGGSMSPERMRAAIAPERTAGATTVRALERAAIATTSNAPERAPVVTTVITPELTAVTALEGGDDGFTMVGKVRNMPHPEKFTGAKGERLEVALYNFETYLTLTNTPKPLWAAVGASFLKGAAKEAYDATAMRVHRNEHRMLGWEEFTSTLNTRFPTYNEQNTARTDFYECKQRPTQNVGAYVAHLKELAGRCSPPIQEADLLHRFSQGLIRDMRVNPITGTLWESFELKAAYIIANQTTVHHNGTDSHHVQHSRYGVHQNRALQNRSHPRLKSAFVQAGGRGGRGGGMTGRGPMGYAPSIAWGGGRDGGRGGRGGGRDGGRGGSSPAGAKRDIAPADRQAKRPNVPWESNPQFEWYAKIKGNPDAPCHKCSHPPMFVQHTNRNCEK
jgi:hypothetical protein